MYELSVGKIVKSDKGKTIKVLSELGSGGQGTVYKVLYDGQEYALKWYKPSMVSHNKAFIRNLNRLIDRGAPDDSFAWPIDATEMVNGTYGYVMKLIPEGYYEFCNYLVGRVKFKDLNARINAGLQIIASFRALHNQGYSYQDMNDGNFFINPDTGKVFICDNENIAPYGEAFGIRGKARYMAPEIVTGKKMPDAHTDRFSMAIILFMLLYVEHPLEGANTCRPCLDDALDYKFFGTEPVFCMDPEIKINRPVIGVHKNLVLLWDFYPRYIQELFIKAFSQDCLIGARIEQRVIEQEWKKALLRLRRELVYCPCGDENFMNSLNPFYCEGCGGRIPITIGLVLSDRFVPVYAGKKLFMSDIDSEYLNMTDVLGVCVENPNKKGLMGLQNTSGISWMCKRPDGAEMVVGPGQTVAVIKGVEIEVNNISIVVIDNMK